MKQFICMAMLFIAPLLSNAQMSYEMADSVALEETLDLLPANSNNTPFSPLSKKPGFISRSAQYLVPAAMFGFGMVAKSSPALQSFDLKIRSEVLAEENRPISRKLEDKLQYVPAYSVFALNALGLKSENKFIDRLALYAISNTIMSKTVHKLKTASGRLRPDGSNNRSFPSGHTATAFSTAEFMRLEYKDASPIYGIAAYTIAATTGALRLYHNVHWFSDVVAGAGIGILSTDLTYFVYPKVKKFVSSSIGFKPKNLHISPTYQSGTAGLAIVYNPK
ncbi:phosphatase PAP2 family protein [Desertivirga arenae]|uniref:phosphatase PAP2 family protein n=1 Tax=Desertivirga arenae TaxID=2810309 RepID=UPI001A974233|nr:phosphatase PAP2 family protein [Pedobacter sp. SYSU D00823]